jgi:hypothetical protein
MSLITVPLLPQATEQYDQSQMAQLIQTLEQMIFVLNNTYAPEAARADDEAFSFFMGDSPSTQETDTSTMESNITTNTNNISTNTSNISTNATNITTANTNITTANTNITNLQSKVSALEKQVRYLIATR